MFFERERDVLCSNCRETADHGLRAGMETAFLLKEKQSRPSILMHDCPNLLKILNCTVLKCGQNLKPRFSTNHISWESTPPITKYHVYIYGGTLSFITIFR